MKKVVWPKGPEIRKSRKPGHYGSFAEFAAKRAEIQAEQTKVIEYFKKSKPILLKCLELRMTSKDPIIVMRPLTYSASVPLNQLKKSDEIEASFYGGSSYANEDEEMLAKNSVFVDKKKTIMPGSILIYKGVDTVLREILFTDGLGEEHAISYDEKDLLLTQTDIFETVQRVLETQKGN